MVIPKGLRLEMYIYANSSGQNWSLSKVPEISNISVIINESKQKQKQTDKNKEMIEFDVYQTDQKNAL